MTFIGDAVKVPEEQVAAVQARYESFFPDARHYGQAHNFSYYWIEPTRIRYIGGFGKIFWIETDDWRLADPEWKDSENYIVEQFDQVCNTMGEVREVMERMAKVAEAA